MRSDWHVVVIVGGDTFRAPKECRAAVRYGLFVAAIATWLDMLDRGRLGVALAGGTTGCAIRYRRPLPAGSWGANGQPGAGWHKKTYRIAGGNLEWWDAALRVAYLVLRVRVWGAEVAGSPTLLCTSSCGGRGWRGRGFDAGAWPAPGQGVAGRSICSGLHGSWMAWRTPPAVWPCRPQEREASERPACRRLKMGRGMVSRLTRSALIASAAVASAIRPWQHGGRWQVPGSARACRTTFVLAGELYLRVRSPLPMTSKADTRNWNGFAFISPRAV